MFWQTKKIKGTGSERKENEGTCFFSSAPLWSLYRNRRVILLVVANYKPWVLELFKKVSFSFIMGADRKKNYLKMHLSSLSVIGCIIVSPVFKQNIEKLNQSINQFNIISLLML